MLRNWGLLTIGAALFIISELCSDHLTATTTPTLFWLYSFIDTSMKPIAIIVFTTALVRIIAPSFISDIWKELMEPKFAELSQNIQKNLGGISDTISGAGDNIEKFTQRSTRKIPLIDCANHEEFCAHMDEAATHAFGPRTKEPDSFYSYVRDRLIESCCQNPYRRYVKKRIKVKNHQTFPDYVIWNETTEYKIHHITWPETKNRGTYPLTMLMSSYAPNLNETEYKEHASLLVTVDNARILHADTMPAFKENMDDDGFFCWKSGDWVMLRYSKQLPLDREYTDIYIEEISINRKDDMLYSMHTSKPIYGHVIEFELPEGFAFIGQPHLSPKIMASGLPTHMDKDMIYKMISVTKGSDRQMTVKIDDWILPGIIVDFNWNKTEQG